MANLAKAFGQLAEKPTLRFAFHGDEHPIVVTCEENEDADALLMPCILKDSEDDDAEEDRQTMLFPEPEKKVGKAMDGIRAAMPGAEVTISSGGRSVKLKGKGKARSKVTVKKKVRKKAK